VREGTAQAKNSLGQKLPEGIRKHKRWGFVKPPLAVTVGFEPTLALTPNNISSVAPSAARTRHQPD
jgi:hypothetical protein